jgi:hypothetical protein
MSKVRTTHACLRDAGLWIELDDWRQSIEGTPDDVGMCHGKDLVRAVYYFLQANYSLPSDVKAETISRLLRTSLWRQDLARWGVGRRLRNWEEHTGRVLLH